MFLARLSVYSCTQKKRIAHYYPRADRTVTQSHRMVPCNPFEYDKSQEDNQEISFARESQESPDITSWI